MNQPMGKLIDGKAIAQKILEKAAHRVEVLRKNNHIPLLGVVLVGENKASQTYVRKKGQAAKKIGIDFILEKMPASISAAELVRRVKGMQSEHNFSGLIVQLPLPENVDTAPVVNAVDPKIDVDCLTDINLGKLIANTAAIEPPTPSAVLSIIDDLGIELKGKNVTIIGAGMLVGKPLAMMMMNRKASVTTCNTSTRDTKEKCLQADIIVTGAGKKDVLRGNMVKEGAIVIDTGVDFVDNKMYGDVNVEEVKQKAAHVTPTPGGVGPITVAQLLWNTAVCAEIAVSHKYEITN